MDQPKFKVGDTVRLRNLPHSEFQIQNYGWNSEMSNYIGKTLTIIKVQQRDNNRRHRNGRAEKVWMYWINENSWAYEEYVLEPYISNKQLIWI